MKIIDAETAERWGREAVAQDPKGEDVVLAGRPPAAGPKRRLHQAAIVAQAGSVVGIGAAAWTTSPIAFALAGGFGIVGLVLVVLATRSRRIFSRAAETPRRKAPVTS